MIKNGGGLMDSGTLKLGVSYKWFNEFNRLTERFLHTDSEE